ncbi:ankyrin repeat domain-containing protein [Legionella erythra]|uniref:Glycosyltransferase n=1 Tax=Legionella erythra TaxID=448 RepID=A0A0W0TEG9_LEGER|nr:ankyrin repeat domain-containing protein [Legionella erythra]KTC93987.1 glycosyltransferase [Legionella erythra]
MQDKEDVSTGHGRIIQLMQSLNYAADERGICNGYCHMGMQAVLLGEASRFKERVDQLLTIPLEDFQEKARIQQLNHEIPAGKAAIKESIRAQIESYLIHKGQWVDALAFFDGIELNQQRRLYQYLFEKNIHLSQQRGGFVDLTIPQRLEERGGILSLPSIAGVYKKEEFKTNLAFLKKGFKQMHLTEPVSLAVTGFGGQHAVSISYNPATEKWILIDANIPPLQEYTDDDKAAEALIRSCSDNDVAAIHIACYTSPGNKQAEEELTDLLLKMQHLSNKNMKKKIKWQDSEGSTWLCVAAQTANSGLISQLIANGADINKKTNSQYTPLMIALLCDYDESAQTLLDCGANPNLSNGNVISPMRIAMSKGKWGMVAALLNKGADPHLRPDVETPCPLEDAIALNNPDLLKFLLAHGANPFQTFLGKRNFMINLAVKIGSLESLKVLLEHGVKANGEEEDTSPLFIAMKNNQLHAARLLLEYGADPNAEDSSFDQTAWQFARQNQLNDFLELFNNPPSQREKHSEEKTTPSESFNPFEVLSFIDALQRYCKKRASEWHLPEKLYLEKENSSGFKTRLISTKFGYSAQDKIHAAHKLIDALQNKDPREALTEFDIGALTNSRLYSTVVKKYEDLFQRVDEVRQFYANSEENPDF